MERTAWWKRFVQFWRWQPRNYVQVWLLAASSFGGAALVAWAIVRTLPLPVIALAYAPGITIFGLGLSLQLRRRRQRGL